ANTNRLSPFSSFTSPLAPVPHTGNQQFPYARPPFQNGGHNTSFLSPNIGPGPGGNPTVNVQGMNPQIQPNLHTQPNISPRISPRIPPQNVNQNMPTIVIPNVPLNGVSNVNPNSGIQNTPGFQNHHVNNQTHPNAGGRNAPGFQNHHVNNQTPPNAGGRNAPGFQNPHINLPTPPNSGGQNSSGFQRQHFNNQSPTSAPNSGVQTPQSLSLNSGGKQVSSPDGNSASFTSVIECPQIPQCNDVKTRYQKEYGTVLGYENTKECHAGYHAGFGDVEGLRHHFTHGAKVNGASRFLNTREHLVIIAARYCSRSKLVEIFKVLKEHNANFKCTSNVNGKTALHHLYENPSLTRDLSDSKGLRKFHKHMKEAIEFLVANGCNINAMDNKFAPIVLMLLKNGADPTVPLKTTVLQPYNAPNALYLAVKIGWPIEVLEALLNKGARGDVKDEN
ncbi:11904_t:CDS:2, partial [Racocetra fulgida]